MFSILEISLKGLVNGILVRPHVRPTVLVRADISRKYVRSFDAAFCYKKQDLAVALLEKVIFIRTVVLIRRPVLAGTPPGT